MTDKPPRLHRSELAVPGSNVRMLEKAPSLGADIVMLDLEDAVAPDDKVQARVNITDALREQDWSGCSVSLRINGLDTHWCYRDLVDVVEEGGRQLDQIMIPKVSCAGDVHLVATLLDQIEEAVGLRHRIGISVLIETAIGMVNIDEIATACPGRMEAMVFGVADYAASLQSHTTSIGGANPNYAVLTDPNGTPERERHWGDQWHYALARIAVTCRAHGLRPIDGPFGARRCSAMRASGRSIRPRSSSPTTSSRPTRTSSTRRIASSPRCATPPPAAAARSPSTAD
jgi:malyl-CoA/(S)-citramalyl-CoA lyase